MQPIRSAIDTLIGGAITYKAATVRTYDEKVFTGQAPDLYILYSTQQETPGPDEQDCTFVTRSSIDIEIIARSGSEVSKDVIDRISNDLSVLINPYPGQAGFADPSGFQITYCGKESAITQNVSITETESILRKIVKFVFIMVEQNA